MNKEQQVVFAIAPAGQGDGAPMLLFGIPEGAWEQMKDGHTHTFDLTKAGLPLKIVIYGGKDHAEVMKIVSDHMKERNLPYVDERGIDFSIKPR